jgi:hypothetical protein
MLSADCGDKTVRRVVPEFVPPRNTLPTDAVLFRRFPALPAHGGRALV